MADKPVCKIEGCDKASRTRGMCNAHYERKRLGRCMASPLIAANGALPAWIRGNAKHKGADCLKWPFSSSSTGYPCNVMHNGKWIGAHRLMCILAHGEAPSPDMQAAHSCGNGHLGCINPDHLRWDTVKGNAEDRAWHGTEGIGSRNPNGKLSEADVLKIRGLKGILTNREIGEAFGVTKSNVSVIMRRKTWTHI